MSQNNSSIENLQYVLGVSPSPPPPPLPPVKQEDEKEPSDTVLQNLTRMAQSVVLMDLHNIDEFHPMLIKYKQ